MTLELTLDQTLIDDCRRMAGRIAHDVVDFALMHSTVSIERGILRLFDVEGADENGAPAVNRIVDAIPPEQLPSGVCRWIGGCMASRGWNLQKCLDHLLENPPQDPSPVPENWRAPIAALARSAQDRIARLRETREALLSQLPVGEKPWFYCIVATGNIHEDVVQAQAAARQGAQIIAVIRSTAQSLLDYVPEGLTTEGYAGTFATQQNFRLMRQALDETSRELGRYVLLCNYASGLCMPEIAALAALERLDMLLNDAMYGIIFRNINMQRTLIDQHFSRRLNGLSGIIINTGEDNYLKTDEGLAAAHTVLASQFINEALARLSEVPTSQMGLGHAFELDPEIEDGFLYELAQALLARQIFPRAPLKYMPPTRYKSGDIFHGYLQDGLFNLTSLLSRQQIQLLGMLSEAVQTPGLQDRYLALRNASYIRNNLRHLPEEFELRSDGRIQKRANQVLEECGRLLEEIAATSLRAAIARGAFAGIARQSDEGRGKEGVFRKADDYYNPFLVPGSNA